jgi:hypothetical protein
MFKISESQLTALDTTAHQQFIEEMLDHCTAFSPKLARVLGEDQMRVVIDRAWTRAEGHGFTNVGPVRLFIELSFLFGSGFDSDIQYPWIREALLPADEDQMERADALHRQTIIALQAIHGDGKQFTHAALRELYRFAATEPRFDESRLREQLIAAMARIHPEKSGYVGEASLRDLVARGIDLADTLGFAEPRERALPSILMFSFGHECFADPVYPFIERTITDERIIDPSARAQRLERKARAWLQHVIENQSKGAAQ